MNKQSKNSPAASVAAAVSSSSPRVPLTGTERKFLRGLAHDLDPVVHVGRAGVTETVLGALRRALDDHELIKVKLAADREERALMASAIEAGCDAEVVGQIGTIAVVFRANPDPEKRRIELS